MFDNILSRYSENWKITFKVLNERSTDDIKNSFGESERKFSLDFNWLWTKFCLKMYHNGDNDYPSVNKINFSKFKNLVNVDAYLFLEKMDQQSLQKFSPIKFY